MTAYTSLADIRATYGADYIDNTLAEVGLDNAQALIDGINALWDGKVVPMTGSPVPAAVVAACKLYATSMAAYRLFRDAPSDALKDHNKQALDFFNALGTKAGAQFAADVPADNPATTDDEAADAAGVAVGYSERRMGRTQLDW